MVSVDARKPKANRALMFGIGFSAMDLRANRDAYMTVEQRGRLRRKGLFEAGAWLALALFIGLVFLALVSAPSDKMPDALSGLLAWGVLALLGLGALGLAAFAAHRWRLFRADLHKGHVSTVAGWVSLDIQGGRNTSYKVCVQGLKFSVSKNALLAFKNGERYRLYYAPYSKTLLSAEPVPDDALIADADP